MVTTPQCQPGSVLDEVPRLVPGVRVERFDASHPNYKLLLTNSAGRNWMISTALGEVIDAIDGRRTTAQILDLLASSRDAATEARLMEIIWNELVSMQVVESESGIAPSRQAFRIWSRPGSGLSVRVPLLPRRLVTVLSSVLQHLYWPPFLVLLALGASATDLWWWIRYGWGASSFNLFARGDWVLILSLVAASYLAHELGHTAACKRYGGSCGPIGFGIYWIFPVLYADISGSWRLTRRHRAITDLGGFYFQLLCAAALIAWNSWRPAPAAAAAVILINFTFLPNLDPLLKMDGYWFLADATGIPNLSGVLEKLVAQDTHVFGGYPARIRALIYSYCVFVVLFVSMIVVQITGQIPRILASYGALVRTTSTTVLSHSWAHLGTLCIRLIASSFVLFLLGIGGFRLGQWIVQAAGRGWSLRFPAQNGVQP